MRHEITHQPAHSLAVIHLDRGESIDCEVGSLVSMSATVGLAAQLKDGGGGDGSLWDRAWGALKLSAMAGVDALMARATAGEDGAELTLAPSAPGDIIAVDAADGGLVLNAGSYLASQPTVKLDGEWAGLKGLVGASGLFFMRVTGSGMVWVTSFGAIHQRTLAAGEKYLVTSGHLLGYREGVTTSVRLAASDANWFKRVLTSAAAGQGMGLTLELTGPGDIWLQTRSPQAFVAWIDRRLPRRTEVRTAFTPRPSAGNHAPVRHAAEPPAAPAAPPPPITSRTRVVK